MALAEIASAEATGPVKLTDIADRQGISYRYLEQLFGKLSRHGIVKGVKGPAGGYLLARKLSDISLLDIMEAVDEPIKTTRCDAQTVGFCQSNTHVCRTHRVWVELGATISHFLASKTLADFVDEPQSELKA